MTVNADVCTSAKEISSQSGTNAENSNTTCPNTYQIVNDACESSVSLRDLYLECESSAGHFNRHEVQASLHERDTMDVIKLDISNKYITESDTFTKTDFLLLLFSLGTYAIDIGTDTWVAVLHYRNGDFWWFGVTLLLILIPGWVMGISNLMSEEEEPKCFDTACCSLIFAIPGFPMLCYIMNMYDGVKILQQNDSHRKQELKDLIFEMSDTAVLRLVEAFLEAAPQCVLQLYIILNWLPEPLEGPMVPVQWAAVGTSLISVCWAIAWYYKLNRQEQYKQKIFISGLSFIFAWKIFTVGTRLFALALFASFCGRGIFILTGIHFVVMLIWIMMQRNTNLLDSEGFCKSVLTAFVLIFCDWNISKEGHTRIKYAFYYTVMYVENVGMLLAWYFTTGSPLWLQYFACALIMGGFFIGIFFQAIYYVKLHPKNFEQDSRHHLRMWVPLSDLSLINKSEICS